MSGAPGNGSPARRLRSAVPRLATLALAVGMAGAPGTAPAGARPAQAAAEPETAARAATAPQAAPGAEVSPGERRARAVEAARDYFTDVELVNQHGEPMRFYSDLIRGKVVVINTIFTTCTGICPLMSRSFEKLQERAGERMGDDVHLVSITVDPETDTPERLREFGERFHAGDGWYFLTGDPDDLEQVLGRLGQWVETPETHQGIVLMGNDRTGLWKKAFGLASSQELLEVFESVLDDRRPTGADGSGADR